MLRKILWLLASTVLMIPAVADAACPPDVTPIRVTFLNGIWTTDESASESLNSLKSAIKRDPRWAQVREECVEFGYDYNQLQFYGGKDLADVFVQFFGTKFTDGLRILDGLSPSTFAFSTTMIGLANQVDIGACLATGADCDSLKQKTRLRAADGIKTLAVSHSQGNLYWNEIYVALTSGSPVSDPRFMSTVAVATPANSIAGNGTYTNLLRDPVTLFSALNTNADNGFTGSCDWTLFPCHYFKDSYLAGSDSRRRILDDIFAILPSNGTSSSPGTVVLRTIVDGVDWSGPINTSVVGPNGVIIGLSTPSASAGQSIGQYRAVYNSGGPPRATFVGVLPDTTQTLIGDGSVTFTLVFTESTAPGTINTRALLDGQLWSGPVDAFITGPNGVLIEQQAPMSYSSDPIGQYAVQVTGGGPTGANLTAIHPAPSQVLTGGQTITFTFAFVSKSPPPPIAPRLDSISPSSPMAGPLDQPVTVIGANFETNLTVTVGLPGGSTSTLSGTQIQNVTPTSFMAIVTFADPGAYTFTAHNPDGGVSTPFAFQVAASPTPTVFVTVPATPPGVPGFPGLAPVTSNQLVVDSNGNLVTTEEWFSFGCGFGFCGTRLLSYSPQGSLNWDMPRSDSPSFPFISYDVNNWFGDAIFAGQSGRLYFKDADYSLVAIDSNGQVVAGWPKTFPGRITTNGSNQPPIIIDRTDGTVFVSQSGNAFIPVFSATYAMNSNGSIKWLAEFSDGGASSGLIFGPNGRIDTFFGASSSVSNPGTLVVLDRENGSVVCRGHTPSSFITFAGGAGGIFTADYGKALTRWDDNCVPSVVFVTDRDTLVLGGYVHDTLIAEDYFGAAQSNPDASSARLMGLAADGQFLWRNNDIQLDITGQFPILATDPELVYVHGVDLIDGLPKVFAVDAVTGTTVARIDTSGLGDSRRMTAAPSHMLYIVDATGSQIYKVVVPMTAP